MKSMSEGWIRTIYRFLGIFEGSPSANFRKNPGNRPDTTSSPHVETFAGGASRPILESPRGASRPILGALWVVARRLATDFRGPLGRRVAPRDATIYVENMKNIFNIIPRVKIC